MPLYEYQCPECGRTEERQRSVDERDAPLDCTCYGEPAMKRKLSASPFTIEGRAYLSHEPSWADRGDI